MKLSFIVAMDQHRGMGYQNKLPWKMPADLQHFKNKTLGKPVVMGRKTYESIGRPLPHRPNIIITRDTNFTVAGCRVFHSIEKAFNNLQRYDEVMVIGGANLFAQLLDQVQCVYLTIIHHTFVVDTFLPKMDLTAWQVTERIDNKADAQNPYDYSFITYERSLPTNFK